MACTVLNRFSLSSPSVWAMNFPRGVGYDTAGVDGEMTTKSLIVIGSRLAVNQ